MSLCARVAAAATALLVGCEGQQVVDDSQQMWRRVPPGWFTSGCGVATAQEWQALRVVGLNRDRCESTSPRLRIWVSEFLMQRFEVSIAEYDRCIDAGVCDPASVKTLAGKPINLPDHAVRVVWAGADSYCRWLGTRLPSEAEWERAARGEDDRIFTWGNQLPACEEHWIRRWCTGSHRPIGHSQIDVSPFGVHDMTAGFFEFTADRWTRKVEPLGTDPLSGLPTIDPQPVAFYDELSERPTYVLKGLGLIGERAAWSPDEFAGFRCVVPGPRTRPSGP